VPEGDTRKERKAIEDGIAAGKDEPITIEVPAAGPGHLPGPGQCQQPTRAHTPARDKHIAVAPLPLLPVDLPNETLAGLAEDLDMGSSELLATLYPNELRYDQHRKAWFYWNGVHWKKDMGGAMLRSILSTQVRSQFQRALIPLSAELGMLQEKEKKDDADNERIAKLKRWCEALNKRIKTLATTGGCKNVAAFAESYLPFYGDWNTHPTMLPCQNGYVDLHTGKLHAPDPAMSFTHILPFDYDPNAEAPKWQAFLDAMQPDREMQHYLQSYAGYAATGIAEEICAFFIGSGANGKTTFCNVLGGIIGDFCAELNAESLLEQKGRGQNFDLAAVEAARLVVARELPGGTLNASTLKQLVDIGKLHIERKYEQPYDIERTHSLVIYANETPRIKDTTDGTWRRLHLVRWDYAVPEDQRVENYHRHIIREEAEGVLAWLVQGAVQYLTNGLKKPAGVRQATENYRISEDEVALFIAQCCVTGDKLYTPAKDLYEAYCEFANGNMSQRAFGKEMTKRFGDTQQRKIGGKNVRCYVGVGLLNEPPPEDEGNRTEDEGNSSVTSPEVGFKASESEIANSHYEKVTEVTVQQIKVESHPSREGSMRSFTETPVTSVTSVDGSGGIPHSEATNGRVTEENSSVTTRQEKNSSVTRQEAAAARYREEDYRLALLARLVTADTGREERSRLYAMETSELEALVHETIGTHEKGGMG
jgi:P4 family phage/plasmid primase-like protien